METNSGSGKDSTLNSSSNQDPTQNPSNPYYLHPGENPGTDIQLDDINYHPWSRAMCRALLSKKKHKFIDGTLPAPKPGERTITEFYTDLKILWEELEALRPTLDCKCKIKCTCALTKHIQRKVKKTERVTNSVVMDKNIKGEEEQEDKSDSYNGNQFTQGQVYQIMKLIQETKNDSPHKVNNFVNDTSNENTVKEFAFNLVFVQKLVKNHNCKLTITSEFCQIQNVDSLKMIGCARLNRRLYLIDTPKHEVTVNTARELKDPSKDATKNIWHLRLGHPSNKILQHMSNIFPYISFYDNKLCDVCHYAKQHKHSFTHNNTRTEHIFDMIHVDMCGRFGTTSMHGHKFFLTIVDDHSRFTWVYPMTTKSKTRNALSRFITLIHNQFNTTIKVICSDNGSDFVCATL
ncbi:uncharacterized protein [Phaseolus vulgaris]|uniref:uncharacterized protein n=1 Tax=Phaseolus vulgaris TaxID=3885 RepID=UPI0035CB4BBF